MQDSRSPEAKLKAKALACVAQREHSRVELRTKLIAYLDRQRRAADAAAVEAPEVSEAPEAVEASDGAGPSREAEIDALLDWLAERDLLSDARFAEGRVRSRAGRFGHRRVKHELSRHGLVLDAATDRHLRQTEPARAHALWSRRFGAIATDPAERARQMRFLLARGFDPEVVRRVLAGAAAPENDETAAP